MQRNSLTLTTGTYIIAFFICSFLVVPICLYKIEFDGIFIESNIHKQALCFACVALLSLAYCMIQYCKTSARML